MKLDATMGGCGKLAGCISPYPCGRERCYCLLLRGSGWYCSAAGCEVFLFSTGTALVALLANTSAQLVNTQTLTGDLPPLHDSRKNPGSSECIQQAAESYFSHPIDPARRHFQGGPMESERSNIRITTKRANPYHPKNTSRRFARSKARAKRLKNLIETLLCYHAIPGFVDGFEDALLGFTRHNNSQKETQSNLVQKVFVQELYRNCVKDASFCHLLYSSPFPFSYKPVY